MRQDESAREQARGFQFQSQNGRNWHGHNPSARRALTMAWLPDRGPRGQERRKIRVPFVPPNPKEFDSTARIGMDRAEFGT
jgi:hypothetical protein